jgi:predicted NBD/HSP70 family sugar kinase
MNNKVIADLNTLFARPNELRIIKSLLVNGDSSRPDLAQLLSLSLSSVTNVVDGLIKKGYLTETGFKKIEKGRSSAILGVVKSHFVSIGVGISKYKVSVEAIDLNGVSLFCAIENLDPNNWETNFTKIKKFISQFLEQSIDRKFHILGIGIARPGFVEFIKKTLPFSEELFEWDDKKVQSYFENAFSLGVEIASLSTAALSGEVYFGCCKGYSSSLLVNVSSTDISIAMIRKNIIDKNIDANSHAFGKRVMCIDPSQLNAIHETSLNQYACRKAIEKNFSDFDPQKIELDYTTIINQAKSGNLVAVQAITKAATFIGIAISDLIGLLVPENCVITGEIIDDSIIYYSIASAIANERAKHLISNEVIFSQPKLKGIEPDTDTQTNYSLGKGSASVVFENLYVE